MKRFKGSLLLAPDEAIRQKLMEAEAKWRLKQIATNHARTTAKLKRMRATSKAKRR